MFGATDLFDLKGTEHAAIFDGSKNGWEALGRIKTYVDATVSGRKEHTTKGQAYIDDNVTIGEGTVVEEGAMILGPSIIGKNCQIRHNAYLRAYSVVGDNCVIGNSTEVKHSVVFNGCKITQFNYVGDTILGVKAHMGAGVKISNLKLTPGTVMLDAVDKAGMPIDSGV